MFNPPIHNCPGPYGFHGVSILYESLPRSSFGGYTTYLITLCCPESKAESNSVKRPIQTRNNLILFLTDFPM